MTHATVAVAAPLHRRMLHAAGWLVGSSVTSQLLRLASNLVLTRLLLPEAFGLMAAVNAVYFALVMFSDLGVWQSVVRSDRSGDARFLGTAWSVQLGRGVLLAIVVLLLALGLHAAASAGVFEAGTVYADPRLPPMLAVLALAALLQGAESMKLALAQRELAGAQLGRLEIGSQLLAMAVTIALAAATRSPWALLAGTLVATAARTLGGHWLLSGPSARPCWDVPAAREIVGFGKWIFVSSMIGFLAANGEKLLLGGKLATATFGLYAIAATLVAAAAGVYATLNGHVIFASLAHALRGEHAAMVRVYVRVQQIADLFLGFTTGVLFVAGQWVVWLLYDPRYHGAGWMLQWLAFGLVAMRHQVVEQVMFARGAVGWVSAANALRAAALVVCIPAGFALAGERGAVAGVVLAQFAGWPLALAFKRREGLLCWATERWWLPALAAGALAGYGADHLLALWAGR
ncbi:MAG: oligosaccharide flippase family protein [Burkholderiales bacterium]